MLLFIYRYRVGILAWIISLVLFSLPGSAFPASGWMQLIHFDKIIHIGLFACLFICWAYPESQQINGINKNLLIWSMMVIYGILIEFMQDNWISNRSFEFMDWIADITGASLGWIIMKIKKPLLKQRP